MTSMLKDSLRDPAGQAQLFDALKQTNSEVSSLLESAVKAGTPVDTKDANGATALMRAAQEGNYNAVCCLCNLKADVEARSAAGNRALHLAAERNHVRVVEYLRVKGANINAKNVNKETPLIRAAFAGAVDAARALLSMRAEADVICGRENLSALMCACLCGSPEIARALVKVLTPEQVRRADTFGRSALHYAAQKCVHCVKACLEGGADLCWQDKNGHTALDTAKAMGPPECVEYLEAAWRDRIAKAEAIAKELEMESHDEKKKKKNKKKNKKCSQPESAGGGARPDQPPVAPEGPPCNSEAGEVDKGPSCGAHVDQGEAVTVLRPGVVMAADKPVERKDRGMTGEWVTVSSGAKAKKKPERSQKGNGVKPSNPKIAAPPGVLTGASRTAGAPAPALEPVPPTRQDDPPAPIPLVNAWTGKPTRDLYSQVQGDLEARHPLAGQLAIRVEHMLSTDLDGLSAAQLDALEEIHHHSLRLIAQARIERAIQQDRAARAETDRRRGEIDKYRT